MHPVAADTLAFTDTPSLDLLYRDIDDSLTTFHNTSHYLQDLRHELHDFLNDYYAKVGSWFLTLELIKHQITAPGERLNVEHIVQDGVAANNLDANFSEIVHKEIRQLFRKAMKLCHPDCSDFGNRPEGLALFRSLTNAQLHANTSSVWWLLKQLPAYAISQDYLRQLHMFHERLNAHIDMGRRHIAALEKSPANQLKQRVVSSEAEGVDLVAVIIRQVQEKVADAKRLLVQVNIQEMASVRRELLACA